jgi:SAM-dependent methyltransferase
LYRYNSARERAAAFKDHFSGQSGEYQKYRPDYPSELFAWLASVAPARRLAIDVATGNGQAAVGLAAHFDAVLATEPSAAQLRRRGRMRASPIGRKPAESISAPTASRTSVTVAQAAHWFDWPRFAAEAGRVLAPGGVLAIWSYGDVDVTPGIDALVRDFSRDVVGPYWPRERRHVDEGYRDLALPFPAIEAPPFDLRVRWDAAAMLGYIDTWSAVRRAGRGPGAIRFACSPARWPMPGVQVSATCAGR